MEQGTMKAIVKDTDTKVDIELGIELLKQAIQEDKQNQDEKSLKYHTMALKEHEKQLEKFKSE